MNSTLFNETNIIEDEILEDIGLRSLEHIIKLCLFTTLYCIGAFGNGLVTWILCRNGKLQQKSSNIFIFTTSTVLFVSHSIYVLVLLTFEYNDQVIGDVFCKIYYCYMTTEHLFLDWTIAATFIISLFRTQIYVRHRLIIIAILSCLAMVPGLKSAGTTTAAKFGGSKFCALPDYHVFEGFKIFGAYVSVIVMVGFLALKVLQKYWKKFDIFKDKVNRLYLVLFVCHWLQNVIEFYFIHGDHNVIVYLFYFINVNTWIIFMSFDYGLNCEIRKILQCCRMVTLEQSYVAMTESEA